MSKIDTMFGLIHAIGLLTISNTDYRQDFDELVNSLERYGAYVRKDGIDFKAIRDAYRPKFENIQQRDQLLDQFERVVGELHDFHATLGSNNTRSPRLVPSGTDIFARWVRDKVVVDQILPESLAAKAGITPGDEIRTINGLKPRDAARNWLGVVPPNERAWDWALNSSLAGRWNQDREIQIVHQGTSRLARLKTAASSPRYSLLTVRHLDHKVLYLRPENSLGESELIRDFDRVLPEMRIAHGIVLDLTNTPGGGNSSVARGIMGLFISKRLPFQRHVIRERDTDTVRDWVEFATPRTIARPKAKLVVLVGRWTGSMGEGLAIGLDAMHCGTVVGTRMAGLRGAVDQVSLPKSGIRVFFPTEEIFHINGTPRHEWVPPIQINPAAPIAWLQKAMELLSRTR